MLYALTTDRLPFLQKSLNVFVALAPVAKLKHSPSTLLKGIASQTLAIDIIKSLGLSELFPANYLQNALMSKFCVALPSVCGVSLNQISDGDPTVNDNDVLATWLAHFPSGTSFKSLDHFGQIIRDDKFQRYDYGDDANLRIYGSHTPPEIDLTKITGVKIA